MAYFIISGLLGLLKENFNVFDFTYERKVSIKRAFRKEKE